MQEKGNGKKKKKKKIKSPNSRFSSSEWDQEAPYLQVSWWGRSLCPEGPPPRWRWSSCRASRGQSGPPRRWRWASPPGGWARPSGRSPRPPAWPTCPPGSPRTWSWPWLPAPRTCCVQSCGGVCVCVCACVRARACGLHTCDGSWRRRRTPEVAFVLFAFGPLALDVNSRGSPPSCLRLRYTSDVLASLAHSCPQLLLSLSLPCAWWLVKRGQITVP